MVDPWVEDASCKGIDTEVFFPERGKAHINEKIIKPMCGLCRVRQQCLDYAIDLDMSEGYYGGLSGKQRRAIKSLRRKNKVLIG